MKLHKFLLTALATGVAALATAAFGQTEQPGESPRTVISLNGEWQIGEGSLAEPPTAFPATVPVPGLVDMATPAFKDVGVTSTLRDAFWYKRTFTLDQPVPAYATLKIYKAMFGNQVILNGTKFDETWMSFSPTYRDVRQVLRPGENELLIRVAAHARLVPEGYAHGLDPEKIKYIPGIFDNVELILTGSPTITNVQVAPDIEKKTADVQVLLTNDSGAPTTANVKYTVREHKSGRIVGTGESTVNLPATSAETTTTVSIPIEDCHLWSPENPFLYDIIVDCGTDKITDRFGMRTFRLDQATGRAMLNGKPYFMRGSNITLYRFFEDSERGVLPWDEEWVRGLHKLVRSMNWNSLRYCIGFPPEFWYDIADEEGILIQDEFPIWNSRHGEIPNWNKPEILTEEFRLWMRDRWNHPCVVIWDAQNETHSEVTGQAIAAVRDMDLSGRPWDNGYGRYRLPGDSYESHPYLFNKRILNAPFMLEDLKLVSGTPAGNHGGPNVNDNPFIINEYAWVWINRDGTPARLGKPVYARLLKGKKATADEYRELNARLIAALTEFWRSNRACAAVLHFTILGYSRPDGHTSDHFIDVANLELAPAFVEYVKDSFAPVGVMIDFFESRVDPGTDHHIGVAVINDLEENWSGKVRLSLLRGGEVVEESEQTCIVPGFGRNELLFPVNFPNRKGDYQLRATITGADGEEVVSLRDITVGPVPAEELATPAGFAIGKPAKASSVTSRGNFPPQFAFDGNPETRWAADYNEPQWLMVDLEAPREISGIDLVWENAFARAYHIETSLDGETWTKIHETTTGYGEEPPILFNKPVKARYVRLTGTEFGTKWGMSLWEMKVF